MANTPTRGADRSPRGNPSEPGKVAPVAMHRVGTRTTGSFSVTSNTLDDHASFPSRHTGCGNGLSPTLRWTPVAGARSYAVIVEDPDAPSAEPFVHWLAWNIPPDVHELPEALSADGEFDMPAGMRQGRNDRGGIGWFGPRPPAGDDAHRYHFQVLALDGALDLAPGADRKDLLNAIDGRVLAKGELVATSQAPARQ